MWGMPCLWMGVHECVEVGMRGDITPQDMVMLASFQKKWIPDSNVSISRGKLLITLKPSEMDPDIVSATFHTMKIT